MSRKILIAVPLAALAASIAIPGVAGATTLQAGEETLSPGAVLLGSSTSVSFKVEGEREEEIATFKCESDEFKSEVTKNEGETDEGVVIGETASGCKSGSGATVVITSNATAAEEEWKAQVGQPFSEAEATEAEAEAGEELEAGDDRLDFIPKPGRAIQYKAQVKVFGVSVATCDFSRAKLRLWYHANKGLYSAAGARFDRQSGPSGVCGEQARLSGQFSVSKGGKNVSIDMS